MASVLVVDDEPHVSRLTKSRLEREGHEVSLAYDGEEALERLAARSFDAMITDVQMPRMNGRELCEAVRKCSENEDLFILVVTSSTESELRRWAEGMPNLEFVEKPVSLNRLAARLAEVLAVRPGSKGDAW